MKFVPFVTAGFPNLSLFKKFLFALEEEGADMIEIGVPYSDPLADGPVIQEASIRAIKQGITLSRTFSIIQEVREEGLKVPLILFTYYNPILQMGLEKAAEQIQSAGFQGVLVPDLPIEERVALQQTLLRKQIPLISLISPTTEQQRRKKIAKQAEGFIYIVSSLGVTGERAVFHREVLPIIREVKEHANVPVVLGFGIKQRAQLKGLEKDLDGYVIGSALIRSIKELEEQLLDQVHHPLGVDDEDRFITMFRERVKEMQL